MKKVVSLMIALFLVMCLSFSATTPTAYAAEEPLSRGAMAQLLVDTFDLEYDNSMTTPFKDVSEDSLYYEAICICYNKGFMNGKTPTTFDVSSYVTRSQFATTLYRLGLPDGEPDAIPADISNLSTEFYKATCAVLSLGIMEVDEDGLFFPNFAVYLSEVDLAPFDTLFNPTTTAAANLDLANGSIIVSENIKGVTVFEQGDTVIRTTAKSGIIRQTNPATATANTITVKSGEVALTISDLNIESTSGSPVDVKSGAKLTLTLVGDSTVVAPVYEAGISVPDNATIIIQGSGSLSATGGESSAGIGGSNMNDGGSISVHGGTVAATGGDGYGGAGIGGGRGGNGGTITITAGTITAIGGPDSAGIGSGRDSNSGTITISGGTVVAHGGRNGAGIGNGLRGTGGTISITSGLVTATGGMNAAGIGDGSNVNGSIIKITGGSITAAGTWSADMKGDSVTIADAATVTVSPDSAHPGVYETIFIDNQPLSSAAFVGSVPGISVGAHANSGLTYQWQYSYDNKESWIDKPQEYGSHIAKTVFTEAQNGCYCRCQITNGWGNVIYTNEVQIFVLAFAQQPQDVEASLNNIASLAVKSSCDNVTYQWQRSYDEGVTWTNVAGEIYSTLIVSTTLSENDALYRCVITATNGDQLASDSARITVSSNAVTYTTEYYLEKPDGSGYVLTDRVVTESSAGASVTAPTKVFAHFTENTAKGTHSGTVAANNSLTLSRYYDRKSYTISFEMNGGAALADITARYEAAVSAPANPTRAGYAFDGWYADEALTEEYSFTTMPGENITVYAEWGAVGAGRGIEYDIVGISLLDENYNSLSAIPKGKFYVEVSVKNLSSVTMDTLVIATYDQNGRFLGMQYLRSNPPVGYTFVLGTNLDNSKGEIAKIKAMMLPVLGGMLPLAEAEEFSN